MLYNRITLSTLFGHCRTFSTNAKKSKKSAAQQSKKLNNKIKKRSLAAELKNGNKAYISGSQSIFQSLLKSLLLGSNIEFNVEEAINSIILYHNKLIFNHGTVNGTKKFNECRLYTIQLLEGLKPENPGWFSVGKKDKFPSKLNCLRPLFYKVIGEKCKVSDQVIRSLLYINRLCTGNSELNLDGIKRIFKVEKKILGEFTSFLNSKKGIKFKGELISKPTLRVVKKGPNGKPKWQTAELEAYVLIESEFANAFYDLCVATNNLDLYEYIQNLHGTFTKEVKGELRKLASIADKGNKSRTIAICDFWTQLLLQPIMDDVKILAQTMFRGVSYSHNHHDGFLKVQAINGPGFVSMDISQWTDAFPASLQKRFMTARFGRDISDAWYKLVVTCPWITNSKTDKTVTYGTGQGMGTAGSFDIATITDLLLLDYLITTKFKLSETLLNKCVKVGDDLFVFDPNGDIKDFYISQLGLEINDSKSKICTENNHVAEFVSMNINYGQNVSRISANICRAVKKNVLDLPQLCEHLAQRVDSNFVISLDEILTIVRSIKDHKLNVIRSFELLLFMNKSKLTKGMILLKNSLEAFYVVNPGYLHDPLIYIMRFDANNRILKNTVQADALDGLLNQIKEKLDKVFDIASSEFDSSASLFEISKPEAVWKSDEPIALMTSKYLLSRSFAAYNAGMAKLSESETNERILSVLEQVNQGLTFKELGVISHVEAYRPRMTRYFNFFKKISFVNKEINIEILLIRISNYRKVTFENDLQVNKPSLNNKELLAAYDSFHCFNLIIDSIKYNGTIDPHDLTGLPENQILGSEALPSDTDIE